MIVLGSADDSITKPGSPWVFRAKHNSTIVGKAYFDYFDHLKNTKKDVPLETVAASAAPTRISSILCPMQRMVSRSPGRCVRLASTPGSSPSIRPRLFQASFSKSENRLTMLQQP